MPKTKSFLKQLPVVPHDGGYGFKTNLLCLPPEKEVLIVIGIWKRNGEVRGKETTSRRQHPGRIPLTGGLLLILAETEGGLEEAFNPSLTLEPEISSIIFIKIPNEA